MLNPRIYCYKLNSIQLSSALVFHGLRQRTSATLRESKDGKKDIDLIDEDKQDIAQKFRPLNVKGKKSTKTKRSEYFDLTDPPRANKMEPDQDWTNVWPAAGVFRHSSVPIPVRMGVARSRIENEGVPQHKSVNLELMKVSNFLHLTPKHIEKHCRVLKQFCTDWPKGLETEEDYDKHFPVEVTTRDFLYNWSLRDERSRINVLKVKLSSLDLDYHARDKLVRLAEGRMIFAPTPEEEELKKTQIGIAGDTPRNLRKEARWLRNNKTMLNEQRMGPDGKLYWRRRRRYGWWNLKKHWLHPEVHALQEPLPEKTPIASYDYETDTLTLHTERCPTRKQNYDHAIYLLKALFGEAWQTEDWEENKTWDDLEKFIWEKGPTKDVGVQMYRAAHKCDASEEEVLAKPEVQEYKLALEELVNFGANDKRMARYRAAVKHILKIDD